MDALMVDYRAMGWHDLQPDGLFSVQIDGWQYMTDHYVLLPTARIDGLPVGYDNLLMPLARQAAEGFGMWLSANVLPDPSDRVFERRRIDPLEEAGFKVRALDGVKDAHGICDYGHLDLVGLITPVRRRHEAAAAPSTHRRAR
jgi:hypothetical protein